MADFMYADNLAGLEGEDDMGILEGLEGEELGARIRAGRRAQRTGRPVGVRMPAVHEGTPGVMPVRALMAPISGVPARGLRKSYLPMGSIAFVLAGLTSQPLTVQPQKPFRPTRVVFALTRTGASATGLVTLTDLSVGQNRQPAAAGAAPIDAFGPLAVDVDVDFDPANTSINVQSTIAITANPTTTDRVDIAGVLFGFMIG
ncbi:MAG: hypothetical protein ACRCU1_15215 [Alsobacter sp.]